jgi:hypothetical protein
VDDGERGHVTTGRRESEAGGKGAEFCCDSGRGGGLVGFVISVDRTRETAAWVRELSADLTIT